MNIIDYSQQNLYQKCPWAWYERYINRRVLKREGQQDDAMTIGSLVHNGLENWFKSARPEVDTETIEEQSPTPGAMETAQLLLHSYVNRYPQEQFDIQVLEEPCMFPVKVDGWSGMAKVDRYFRIDELSELVANEEGHTITLEPGIWIMEHKTKGQSISRANWIMEWEINRQASYQMLALRERFGDEVRGLVVNVIEKPKIYVPKRKCKGCGEQYELASFIPKEDGHACMVCGTVQKLSPYKPTKDANPTFFRTKVTRTKEQLDSHLKEISLIAMEMEFMKTRGMESAIPNSRECVNRIYGPCEYLTNHLYNVSTFEDSRMTEKDTSKYMGLTIL